MNEITRIHLAATPYNIELAAKKELEIYLQSIEKSLKADAETMREIESRIVELLTEQKITGEMAVTAKDVEAIKQRLGDPSDFADDTAEQPFTDKQPATKRLMRDPQNALLGGVCAGVAAYFGIDVVLTRVIAVVLLFVTSGVMIPIYLVMWFIMPEAKTAADRLTMAGEPITLSSLKDKTTNEPAVREGETPLAKIFRFLAGIIALLIAAAAFIAVLTVSTSAPFFTSDLRSNIEANSWIIPSISLMAVAGVLLSILFGLFANALFTKRFTKKMGIVTVTIILLGILSFGAGAGILAYNARTIENTVRRNEITKTIDIGDSLTGIDTVVVNTKDIRVDYMASGTPKATAYYNAIAQKTPQVTLKKEGSTLFINTKANFIKKSLWNSDMDAKIALSGPVLNKITVDKGSFVYQTASQDTIETLVESDATFSLETNGTVNTLRAIVNGSGVIDATPANIAAANITFGDGGNATFATLNELRIIAPTSCRSGTKTNISADYASVLYLNNAKVESNNTGRCINLTLSNDDWEN